jgi:DNA-binding response OmpR family regulator/HPt (histidine-containing phosphotransfer) domain-containing protein
MRILLVEDDESIVELVSTILNEQNYVVDVAMNGEDGWELIDSFPYDLVLLDIVLPGLDGIAFCHRLRRQQKQVLVMLLTARDTTTDKLLGLDAGADDYVVKPFDPRELTARIRALLRRGNTVATPVLTCGNLQLNPSSCEVTYNGHLLRFSRKEYLLLELFLRHQHRVFSRSAIVDQVWSFSEDPPNEDTVKSHIKSIRRKLDAVGAGNLIETLYGQGYRINPAYLTEAELSQAPSKSEQVLDASVAKIWEKTRQVSFKRIHQLVQAVAALKTKSLDLNGQQTAIQNAHKLAGSLGTFGFDDGSHLAQQLEFLFQSLPSLTATDQQQTVLQAEQIVNALQKTVAAEGFSLEPDPPDPPDPPDLRVTVTAHPVEAALPLLLIVDRDPDFVQQLTAHAAEQKIRTVAVTTLNKAQKQCAQERPNIVLINLSMIRTDQRGPALLDDLKRSPAVPIVLLSAEANAQARIDAVRAGGTLFLHKPLPPSAALAAITTLLLSSAQQPLKMIVVDDDPITSLLLQECLSPQGIQVVGLDDAEQLWDLLNSVHPDFLILDVNMPQMDGIDLCQTIRNDPHWSWLPIIFLTAQTDDQTRQRVFLAGADDVMTKPIDPVELSARIWNRFNRTRTYQRLLPPS